MPIAKGTDWNGNTIQHTANLPQLASDIKATANKYLKNNNVKDFEQKPERVPNDILRVLIYLKNF